MILSKNQITKGLIRLSGCAGWSAPVLFADPRRQVFSRWGPYNGKCSKILNTFLFLFSNKMLVIRAGSHKMLGGIANREDPDKTAEAV